MGKITMSQINWVVLDPPERKRVYHFPGADRATFANVTKIEVRASGVHRIEADGKKFFVQPGWLWMEIDVDEWTF